MEVELGYIEENQGDAWMEQHIHICYKWLKHWVLATPMHPKATSNKQTKNSYFRNLQIKKFCDLMASVAENTTQMTRLKILSSQSKGKKDKIMTKKEMAMFEEMMSTIKALNERIDNLEKVNTVSRTKTVTSKASEKSESKDSKKSVEVVVGNLVFSGKYVKTGTGFMSSKTRYAIGKSITENFGGVKLSKGNPIYDKCHKADKYVQVYEFKTVEDCKKFMDEQVKRVG